MKCLKCTFCIIMLCFMHHISIALSYFWGYHSVKIFFEHEINRIRFAQNISKNTKTLIRDYPLAALFPIVRIKELGTMKVHELNLLARDYSAGISLFHIALVGKVITGQLIKILLLTN